MKKTHTLVGDFNINALCTDSHSNLRHMLTNNKLLVSQPTHLDGALLDYVYIADSFSAHKTTLINKNIYYSDHDAVILHIGPNKNNNVNEDIDFNVVWRKCNIQIKVCNSLHSI